MQLLILNTLAALVSSTLAARHFQLINSCPAPINIYEDGTQIAALAVGAQLSRDYATDFTGHFWTDANGGNNNGVSSTIAGFYAPYNFSYIIRDPEYFNVALRVAPIGLTPSNGFCIALECDSLTCVDAFDRQPRVSAFPPPQPGVPPTPPMAACNTPDTGYTVTFCPGGSFPNITNIPTEIHPIGDETKCVDVRGAVFANGTPVQIYDCNGSSAQKWLLHKYNTKVQLAGTNFCLDSGTNPINGSKMKIWQCFDNLAAQAWYYDDNGNIKLPTLNQCLDVTDGQFVNSNPLQVWQCAAPAGFNANQVFQTFNSQ